MPKAVWGLDISRTSIKAVRLEARKDGVVLTHLETYAYRGGQEGQVDPQAVRDAVVAFRKQARIGSERVCASYSAHNILCRLVRIPPVPEDRVSEIVRYEVQSQLPSGLEDFVWDFHMVQREYGTGEEREVLVFAAKRAPVEELLQTIEPAGLNLEVIQFAPVALYNFLVYDQSVEPGTVVLDIGAQGSDLILVDHGKIWVRQLSVSASQFTRAIATTLKVKGSEAEKLKRGPSPPTMQARVYEALRSVYQELASEIHRTAGFYKGISRGANFRKFLLAGNGSKAFQLQRHLAQALSMEATRLSALGRIKTSPRVDQSTLAGNLPALGTSLGLALQGLGLVPHRSSMLPPAYVRRRLVQAKAPMVIAAAAVLLVAALVAGWGIQRRADGMAALAQRIEESQTTYQRRLAQLKEEKRKLEPLQAAIRRLDALYVRRELDLRVLSAISANLPDNSSAPEASRVWLLEVQAEHRPAEAAQAGPTPGGARTPERFLPSARHVVVTLEVAMVRYVDNGATDRTDPVITRLIQEQLLNCKQPTMEGEALTKHDPNRPSILDAVEDPQQVRSVNIQPHGLSPRRELIAAHTLRAQGHQPTPGAPAGYRVMQIEITLDPHSPAHPAPATATQGGRGA